ncbi:hypothetical protein AAG570_009298 [Ranatra chinensis]|uniref:Uncharacterized protein n=1 Tax=Ranatra chinensis TaxID=642074 RepID=A0ABD0Z1P5_9HEMI
MASKRRNMFYQNKKQAATEIGTCNCPSFLTTNNFPAGASWLGLEGSQNLEKNGVVESINKLRARDDRPCCRSPGRSNQISVLPAIHSHITQWMALAGVITRLVENCLGVVGDCEIDEMVQD